MLLDFLLYLHSNRSDMKYKELLLALLLTHLK